VTKVHNTVTTGQLYPNAHLLMYRINNQPSTPRSVTIQNQFTVTPANPTATSTLTTGPAVILAVPSTKEVISSSAPPTLPPPASTIQRELDHFKCYLAVGDPRAGVNITLTDQFETNQPTALYTPFLFCNPVLKVHYTQTVSNTGAPAALPTITPVNHPRSHLTCYVTVPSSGSPVIPPPVLYNNQFVVPGTVSTLALSSPDMLCVPTFKIAWNVIAPPTTTAPTTTAP
jgi:hypothetical protein